MPQTPKWAAHAKPGPYVTGLSSSEEPKFQSWVKQNAIPWKDSPTSDYDMRGFWKAQQQGDPYAKRSSTTKHFPDTWKTPYHETFSNQSKYALPTAGHWEGDTFVPPKEKSMPNDVLTDVKRQQEVADRPGKTAPTPMPPGLHEFSGVSYKEATPKNEQTKKSEMAQSLDWVATQRKVAEQQ
jgi:hypothetical protein